MTAFSGIHVISISHIPYSKFMILKMILLMICIIYMSCVQIVYHYDLSLFYKHFKYLYFLSLEGNVSVSKFSEICMYLLYDTAVTFHNLIHCYIYDILIKVFIYTIHWTFHLGS